jgi:hypothetical protein
MSFLTLRPDNWQFLQQNHTFCPDACPTTLLAELSQVRARLEEAAKRVQVAFIGGFVRED